MSCRTQKAACWDKLPRSSSLPHTLALWGGSKPFEFYVSSLLKSRFKSYWFRSFLVPSFSLPRLRHRKLNEPFPKTRHHHAVYNSASCFVLWCASTQLQFGFKFGILTLLNEQWLRSVPVVSWSCRYPITNGSRLTYTASVLLCLTATLTQNNQLRSGSLTGR